MFKRIADNRNEQSLAVEFRRKRFALFQSLLSRLERPLRILDIGGTENFWKTMGVTAEDCILVTLLNVNPHQVSLPYLSYQVGDARQIQADDQSFDVIFSNSVIEHVGSFEDQFKMAEEVKRVGKCYFIQTPNKYFPLEPHFLIPFYQFLPIPIRILLLRNFNLGWFARTPDARKAKEIVEGVRLLGKQEFIRLFPDARIYEEKIFGLTKSFVAYGGWGE